MSVAASEAILKRRIDDYLWRDRSAPLVELRQILGVHFMHFDEIVIIGGLVRDIARDGQSAFSSDIDLVVGAKSCAVENLAQALKAKRNNFGGFSYHTARWKIDFWALEVTWAFKEGLIDGNNMADLLSCTFFDWDAALYDLRSRQTTLSPRYLDKIKSRCLEVNLAKTPSVEGNLLRAIRRLMLWNVEPGPRLKAFITEYLTKTSLCDISKIEMKLFANPIVYKFSDDLSSLHDYLFNRSSRKRLATWYGEQLMMKHFDEDI